MTIRLSLKVRALWGAGQTAGISEACGACSLLVFCKAFFQIIRMPDVDFTVAAFDHVGPETHKSRAC